MNEPLHPEVAILNAALELPPGQRPAYLDKACAGNPALRRQVEDLLESHAQAKGFLEGPPTGLASLRSAPADAPPAEKAGDRIGRYKLLQQIGEGGCGVVYMAEQEEPVRRRVALKVIKLGMDTKQVIARFEAERQAIALMDHPNIARVLDAGATETGRPYFVMELVRGIKITDYCDRNNLSTKERLDLFVQVCRAVQHAHQKGIIHRDIKPSNILVASNDGVPVPKVIDFGIAKATQGRLTDETLFTAFEQFIGTPAYMSPEQAGLSMLDIDTRTDIYSLGVLLYELLTGKTPFDAKELLEAGLDEMRRIIRDTNPPRPSTRLTQELVATDVRAREPAGGLAVPSGEDLSADSGRRLRLREQIRLLKGDLDWIVMKCLEKDRARRYETANGLAADITRHLRDEPVVARPPSRVYEFQKSVRRHRFGFAAAAALILVLAAGVLMSTWQAVRATRAEGEQTRLLQRAEEAGDLAKQQEQLAVMNADQARQLQRLASDQESMARRRFYAAQMNLAMQAWDAGQAARTLALLKTLQPAAGQPDLRGFEWFHLWRLCNARLRFTLHGHTEPISRLAFAPDDTILASCSRDGTIRLWDVSTGRERRVLRQDTWVDAIAFTPDGSILASGGRETPIRLWDVVSGQVRATLSGRWWWVRSLAVSPDGKTLASSDEAAIRLWDLKAGIELTNFPVSGTTLALAFSPDGSALASAANWGDIRLEKVTFSASPKPFPSRLHFDPLMTLAWSPDGRMLATASWDEIRLRDAGTGHLLTTLKGHSYRVSALAFLSDGKTLASCSGDRTVRLWPLSSNGHEHAESRILGAHYEPINCLTVSSDGALLASGSSDASIRLWDLRAAQDVVEAHTASTFLCRPGTNLARGVFSLFPLHDNHAALAVTLQGTEIHDLESGQLLATFPSAHGVGAISPDGRLLATSLSDGTVSLWHVEDGRLVASVQAHTPCSDAPALAFASDGKTLFTGGFADDMTLRFWDASAGLKPIRRLHMPGAGVSAIACSGDGRWLAVGIRGGAVLLLDAINGRTEEMLPVGGGLQTEALVFSPDGKRVAAGGEGGTVKLWEVPSGQLLAIFRGHETTVFTIAFSPDGETAVTGGADQTVRLWDVATGQERVTFKRHRDSVNAVAFSPDGDTLLTADRSGTVWVLRGARTAEADEGPEPRVEVDVSHYNSLAWSLATDGDPKLRNGRKALEFAQKAVANTHRTDAGFLDTLAAAYAETGDFTNALSVQRESLALLRNQDEKGEYSFRLKLYEARTPYRDHGRLAERASALLAEGKFAEAAPLARECLGIRETMIPNDWRTFSARSVLGGCLLGQKEFTEAEPLLISAYEGMKQREATIPLPGKPRLPEAVQRLVKLYEETGRTGQAAEWRKELAEFNKVRPER